MIADLNELMINRAAAAKPHNKHYMAPERLENEWPTIQSDLWSCGVIIYELLHSKRPFNDESDTKTKNELEFNDSTTTLKLKSLLAW